MDEDNESREEMLNDTDDTMTSHSNGIYYGLNGFGITWLYFMLHVLLFFVAGTGIVLNSLAMYVLQKNTNTPTVDISRIFIVNLACSDIIIDVTCIYTVMYNLIHYKNYYECAFRNGLMTSLNLNSALHLLSLTFDGYCKIVFPYRYVHLFKEESAKKYCVGVWIFCLVLSVLPVIGWREQSPGGVDYCSFFGVMSRGYLIFTGFLFLVTLTSMVFCYVSIWYVAVKQSRRVGNVVSGPKHINNNNGIISNNNNNNNVRQDSALFWRPTRTVLTLVLFYVFCWLPFGTVALLHLTDGFSPSFSDDQKGVLAAYSSFFVFLNTIGNPVIYVKRIQAVRIKLMTMFLSPHGKLYERYVASRRQVSPTDDTNPSAFIHTSQV